MTELERQLTAALETLSGQFETEQRQHFEQVEALQQRFEQQAWRTGPCGSEASSSRGN